MNIKDIAATLAILGSGALAMTGCGKDKPATEVPAGDEAAPTDAGAEAKCSAGHTDDQMRRLGTYRIIPVIGTSG